MLRDQKVPLGPRPAGFSPSKARENSDPNAASTRSRLNTSATEPTLHASSRNNHSLFSFGDSALANPVKTTDQSPSYDFLPSVNFDDLHSSIMSSSNELQLTQFPAPSGQGSIISQNNGATADMSGNMGSGANGTRPPVIRRPSVTRAPRSSSFTRRQTTSTTTNPGAVGTMDSSAAPIAHRTRRTSQYPPVSTSNNYVPARKSIGPSGVDSDSSTKQSQKRRPSVASSFGSSVSSQNGTEGGPQSRRNASVPNSNVGEGARGLTISRAAKTKSLQPTARQGSQQYLSSGIPENYRASSYGGKSPHAGRGNSRLATTPTSAGKRLSVMPGMPPGASHATGLGARTISPTDARRAKRLSTMQVLGGPPPVPRTPPTPQPDTMGPPARATSRSPSLAPRKMASTPSSSRTTPDINRKSHSSGLSNASAASYNSYNTARTSTGSLQPRPAVSSSRLPTPKPQNHQGAVGAEDEEVPPVPAIPKVYESPKDSPLETPFFINKVKMGRQFDTSSINSTSTGTGDRSGNSSVKDLSLADPPKQTCPRTKTSAEVDSDAKNAPSKKNLQPLRLPPLNLLPLSTPTTTKIAALETSHAEGNLTPPAKRTAKTPSSPMTASKASFSRYQPDDMPEQTMGQMRSASSIHHSKTDSGSLHDRATPSAAIPIVGNNRQNRQTVSPFVSSSLPKSSGGYSFMPKANTTADLSSDAHIGRKPSRINGPRAPNAPRERKPSKEVAEISSPEEPQSATSGSSLRRKLSMGWKRSASKTANTISHAASERESEYPPQPPKHGSMPTPKLPASATTGNVSSNSISSPSPSVKSTTYLDPKRRKSSASSLSIFSSHDGTRSDTWGLGGSPKKDSATDGASEQRPNVETRSTSRLNPMQKMLQAKASNAAMKNYHPTAELDKDDLAAEEEMKRLASRRKETEQAARVLDALRSRAKPRTSCSPRQVTLTGSLNIHERGEIVDFQEVYFWGTEKAEKHVGRMDMAGLNYGFDDERGDYNIVLGDHLMYRYEIVDVLGKGSFGQVVRCVDHKTGELVAVKIIRNKKRFHQQALVEVNILKKLLEWDPQGKHSMVNFKGSFYFRNHLCISTELLDMNLYEFIKFNGFRGCSLKLIRRFTKQMLSSLCLLKQQKVIHCDLKPENILLNHPMHSEIRVIDFGSSCFENEKVYTYIQSRFYRSPEVILGMTYGMPIDMWSLGCILAELYTGYPIFPGENEQEQLACIMEVFGPPEKHLIEKSTRKKLFFDSLGKPRLTVSSKGRRRRPSSKSLQQALKCDDEPFLDFLARCLRWDPDRRMKPDEAIRHEFITGQKSSMPLSARAAARNDSPVKRSYTTATPASSRPLPEPPVTSFKNGAAVRTSNGVSPVKANVARRQSAATTFQTGSTGSSTGNERAPTKRASLAPTGSSALPRVTRSVSARQDLAAAGASAALTTRRG